jgi:hypothetical protein
MLGAGPALARPQASPSRRTASPGPSDTIFTVLADWQGPTPGKGCAGRSPAGPLQWAVSRRQARRRAGPGYPPGRAGDSAAPVPDRGTGSDSDSDRRRAAAGPGMTQADQECLAGLS